MIRFIQSEDVGEWVYTLEEQPEVVKFTESRSQTYYLPTC